MTERFDASKYGIGQSVPRKEDPTLVRGLGSYTDDLSAKGQVYLAFVHSPVAHGIIRSVDVKGALAMDGVLGAWTGADMKASGYKMANSIMPAKNRDGSPYHQPERIPLAVDRVRLAGDLIVAVAATTKLQAQSAAEAVVVDIEELPSVTDAAKAAEPGAPQLFDNVPNNVAYDFFHGDEKVTNEAFAKAAHIARVSVEDPRIVINPMELRSCLAEYDAKTDHFTLSTQSQGVFPLHAEIAGVLGIPTEKVTVKTGSVGGSFGMRIVAFPEQVVALHAARALKRPVKWTEDRTTSFLTDYHGRANRYDVELAADKDGKMLAMRIKGFANLGGYLNPNGLGSGSRNIVGNVNSMYRLPVLEVGVKCVLTNTSPTGAYRGAGRQCANYIMERIIDEMAVVSGIDKIALRRINQIKPSELPYKALSGLSYDSGDYTALMDDALKAADVKGFKKRRAQSLKNGKLRGLGIGCFLEATSVVTKEFGEIRFEANGDVTFVTGTLDYGQGHATTFAQILGGKLGVPFDKIKLSQGNSDDMRPWGGYTGGSRSVIASGTVALQTGDKIIEKALLLANWALGTNANEIEFKDGRVTVVRTGEGIDLIELARRVREAKNLPKGLPETLNTSMVATEGANVTFPNGCHICEVEIEQDTGIVEVVSYIMTNDIGVVVNPMLADGQCHGGVVQGIGQVLMEAVVYDDNGQLASGSFTDYCMPRANDFPNFEVRNRPTLTPTNVMGVKGVGESGCAGSVTSVMNGIVDALSMVGVRHIDMPVTPNKVWKVIQDAKRTAA